MMSVTDSESDYTARPVELTDYGWLCETLEDFPLNGGFSMVQTQNELNAMRRLYRVSRGVAVVVLHDLNPISITTMARKNKADDFAVITIQATHPDYRQQGHGSMTSLMRGYIAFELEQLDYLAYDVEQGNLAGEGLVRQWEGVHDRSPDVNAGRIEPNKTYNRSTFTSADWAAFVLANSIDLTRFTFTP